MAGNLLKFPTHIDNTMRKELVKCQMAAHYKFEMGLHSLYEKRVDLVAGGAFAAGIEAARKAFYAEGLNKETAQDRGIKALNESYGSFAPESGSNKTRLRMAGALAFYLDKCPLDTAKLKPFQLPDGKWTIEVGFNFPIGIAHPGSGVELEYCGRFDMLAMDEHGDCWVVDEKTTSMMGDKWSNQWLLDSQMTGYCWGAQKLLEQHGLNSKVVGAVTNGIAIRKYDYEHGQFLATREQWEVDRWFGQISRDIVEWREAYLYQQHSRALDHACAMYNNPCEFVPLCKSRNPDRLIDGSYVVRFWNPMERG